MHPGSDGCMSWTSCTATQPTTPLPKLSVTIVSQVLSVANADASVVVQATDPTGNPVLGTVTINGVTGNSLEQITFKNTCGTGCVGSVYAPNFPVGSVTAAAPTATTPGIRAPAPLYPSVSPPLTATSYLPATT